MPAFAKNFNDVPTNHWAYKVIDEISDKTIMVGMAAGVFSPDTKLTRAQYTAILFNLAPDKSVGTTYMSHLTDIPDNAWYAEAAEWGVTRGIIKEIDGRFEGDQLVSRELMADMTRFFLSNYYWDTYAQDYSSAGYADEDQITEKYKNAVNLLSNNGLLAGRGNNNFEPQGTLTRAEAAAMASRLLEVAGRSNISLTPDEPEQPSEEPGKEDPPTEKPDDPSENDPSENQPSDPSTWDLDGAPKWFLVGKPDEYSAEKWSQLTSYWQGKESIAYRNVRYPSALPSYIRTESAAKSYMIIYLDKLYDYMIEDLTAEDPSTWDLDGAPDWFLVGKPDNYTDDQWKRLIAHWEVKEELAHSSEGYPVELPDYIRTEAEAKEHLQMYIDRLYEHMLKDNLEDEESQKMIQDLLSGSLTITAEEQKMVDMVNEQRRAQGLNELKLSPVLCRAAAIRADEAADKSAGLTSDQIRALGASYFHSRPNGDPVTTILNDVGLGKYITKEYGGTSDKLKMGCGENLSFRTYEKHFDVEDAFESLWNSEGHRQNMLNSRYDYIGVALCERGTHSVWTQLFLTVY